MEVNDLVLAVKGRGKRVEHGSISKIFTHFEENCVGIVREFLEDDPIVLLVGPNQQYAIPIDELGTVHVEETGDGYSHKICNRCHVLTRISHQSACHKLNVFYHQ